MGGYLVFLFLITGAYIAYFSLAGARRPDGAQAGKLLTAGYLLLSTLMLVAAMVMHLQFPGEKVAASVRHIQYRGVDVTLANLDSDVSNVRLTGDAIDGESEVKRGFRWFGLGSGGWIDLLPDKTDNNKILSYRAVARRVPAVVRLNRRSINLPLGGWANVGTKAQYRIERVRKDTIEFGLEVSDGEVRVLSSFDKDTHSTGLKNRSSLRDVLGASGAAKLATALAGHSTPDGFPLLDRLTVVRYAQGDGESAVGIIGADMPPVAESPSGAGDAVEYKLALSRVDAAKEESTPSIEAVEGVFRLDASSGTSRSTLSLPSNAEPTKDGHVRLRFLFNPPRAYPLPPAEVLKKNGNTVRLSSVEIGQPGDGYLFDTGNLNESYTATARLTATGDRMGFLTSASDREEQIEPNRPYPLSGGAVSPVFALADPLRDAGMPWLLPAGGLVLGMLLCMASFMRLPGRRRVRAMLPRGLAGSHFAFVLWAGAAVLLTVRLILAYRVSTLPPFNMDTAAAESYQDCWPKAIGAMLFVLPGLGLLTFLVVRFKERATVPPLALKFSEGLRRVLPKMSAKPYQSLARASFIAAFVLVLFSAIHKKFPFVPFPDAALLGVLLLVLGVVFEGVGDVRDEALTEDQPEPPSAKERMQAITEKLQPVVKAKEFVGQRPGLQKLVAWLGDFSRNRLLWLTALLLMYVDAGTFLFILPFCLALCIGAISTAFGRREPVVVAKVAFLGLLAFFLIGMRIAPNVGGQMLTGSVLGKLTGGSSISYRMAATSPVYAESLLLDPATRQGTFRPRDMQRTLHQRWQMIAYAKGAGAGYFGAPLSNLGMTYPTMLSDASFSVFVLGEHGKPTGWLVIGFLLLMSFTVFRAAWSAATSRTQRSNVRGLYAIAGILGASGVYMSLANLWVVPFTGQNVPFLSLNSIKDLILNGCLLAAAILLIAFPGTFSAQADPNAKKDAKKSAWLWWSLPGLLGLGWIVLGFALLRTGGDPAEPFNYSSETLDNLQQIVDAGNDRARREQLPLNQVDGIRNGSPLVRSLATSYVAGEVTETPITESRSGSRLVIDKRFFRLPSPFEIETGVAWHGSLLAQGAVRRHQLFIGGSRVPVILRSDSGPADIVLGRRIKPITAQAIALKQEIVERGRRQGFVDYGGFKLVKDKVVFRWRSSGKPGTILVNGKRPELPLNELTLNQDDVISLEYSAPDGVSEKLTIVYPGPMEAKLSLVSWRNGRYRRTFPQGGDFPLAYTIAQVGDENVRNGGKKLDNVDLSLDLGLQRELQSKIRQWCLSQGRLTDTGSRLPDGLPFTTVAILDTHTGQVRALAALPQRDPNDSFDSIRDLFPTERDALYSSRSSWALANRTIGSSVKPLTFAAISSQLNGQFDLSKLRVNESIAVEDRAYRKLGDIHLPRGRNLSSRENARSEVDMAEFLRDSRTWPAVVIGTIGLVSDKSDVKRQKAELAAMFQGPTGFISVDGHSVGFQPRSALDRIFTKGLDLNSVELSDTALFRGLQDCYGPSVVPFNVNESAPWDDKLAKSFLKPLDLSSSQASDLRRLGLPDLHRADTTNMTKLDLQLVPYMIGAGESRWNALTMAINGARLMTGKKVMPSFDAKAVATKEAMPKPIDNLQWRQAHLITPLRNITTLGSDGEAIRSAASGAGYVIAMKTGTIDDGMGDRARESEMLMFTIGRYSDASGFLPGQSISGFLSIRSSKLSSGEPIVKGDLMRALMPTMIRYLRSHGGGKK